MDMTMSSTRPTRAGAHSTQHTAHSRQYTTLMSAAGAVMSNNVAYLRFLNLTQAVNSELTNAAVDLLALRLLDAIALAHSTQAPLTVSKAMALNSIASPATLHRKLDQLREAGLIEQTFEGKNRRTKYLVLTPAAGKYFEQLGKALVLACENSSHTN